MLIIITNTVDVETRGNYFDTPITLRVSDIFKHSGGGDSSKLARGYIIKKKRARIAICIHHTLKQSRFLNLRVYLRTLLNVGSIFER